MVGIKMSTGKGFDFFAKLAGNLTVALDKTLPKALSESLVSTVGETIRKDWLDQSPSSGYGLSTGNLEKSWKGATFRAGNTLSIVAYTMNRYAGVHVTGRVINGNPILVIPMENALKYWGSELDALVDSGVVGLLKNPMAIVVQRVTLKPKPINSSKNYLELAAERFLARAPDVISPVLSGAVGASVGGTT
jgi:hypothetical protein